MKPGERRGIARLHLAHQSELMRGHGPVHVVKTRCRRPRFSQAEHGAAIKTAGLLAWSSTEIVNRAENGRRRSGATGQEQERKAEGEDLTAAGRSSKIRPAGEGGEANRLPMPSKRNAARAQDKCDRRPRARRNTETTGRAQRRRCKSSRTCQKPGSDHGHQQHSVSTTLIRGALAIGLDHPQHSDPGGRNLRDTSAMA